MVKEKRYKGPKPVPKLRNRGSEARLNSGTLFGIGARCPTRTRLFSASPTLLLATRTEELELGAWMDSVFNGGGSSHPFIAGGRPA